MRQDCGKGSSFMPSSSFGLNYPAIPESCRPPRSFPRSATLAAACRAEWRGCGIGGGWRSFLLFRGFALRPDTEDCHVEGVEDALHRKLEVPKIKPVLEIPARTCVLVCIAERRACRINLLKLENPLPDGRWQRHFSPLLDELQAAGQ